ncbi:MAG: hypothetical protein HRT77_06910 [Halioglobus sp.]|nr:hypothetical protein [Halioglobus sp.]
MREIEGPAVFRSPAHPAASLGIVEEIAGFEHAGHSTEPFQEEPFIPLYDFDAW